MPALPFFEHVVLKNKLSNKKNKLLLLNFITDYNSGYG